MKESSVKLVLTFPKETWDKPVIYKLVKDYDLVVNILRAEILPKMEGSAVLELKGDSDSLKRAVKFLKGINVKVRPLELDIFREDEKCIHCGACIAPCPTNAFYLDPVTFRVEFDKTKCVGCGHCIPACPTRIIYSPEF
ncbi:MULTISPECIES: NIL domain-containing protein [unclassified Desulfurobacterium]|uniref:NIL domain-containing protein n=1 Tax=unclassified Desulfurobacterium TaxID=2639089 RepID=UPI0003B65A01|nr:MULTISPECIES: NIL domain-containing protein [unclassified Desulfurobacterium]